jgi:orotidine-5'-phosphate decarboxylase
LKERLEMTMTKKKQMINPKAKEYIIVALDVEREEEVLELVSELRDYVGFFKVGLELVNSLGFSVIRKVTELGGKVFLDLKFMDIPNTVAGASRGAARLGVKMFDIHTLGGFEMMSAAVNAINLEAAKSMVERPLLLGVTILTSMSQSIMNNELRISGSIENQVAHLASMASRAGLDGVIASPREVEVIRKNVSDGMLIVTPGVRPDWAAANDQKRVMTPSEAILKGASHLVLGRPITKPPAGIGSSVQAAKLVLEEISSVL